MNSQERIPEITSEDENNSSLNQAMIRKDFKQRKQKIYFCIFILVALSTLICIWITILTKPKKDEDTPYTGKYL